MTKVRGGKIKVLVADDSRLICTLLNSIFAKADDFEVLGFAKNGEEVIQLTKRLKPDIVTMDIMMPILDGYEATKQIMAETPTPIVVLSSLIHEEEVDSACQALAIGALDALPKFFDSTEEEFEEKERQFLNTLRALSEVKVIRRRKKYMPKSLNLPSKLNLRNTKIIGLGVSTGGPEALIRIFSGLKVPLPVPVVIVLHISKGFLPGLVRWLQAITPFEVVIAKNNEVLLPEKVYLAPDENHFLVRKGETPVGLLYGGVKEDPFKPGVNQLFNSLAKAYPGKAVGGILTGMGSDGAEGLLAMKESGCYTFAQTAESSMVSGMPDSARLKGAVTENVSLDEIPAFLEAIFDKKERES